MQLRSFWTAVFAGLALASRQGGAATWSAPGSGAWETSGNWMNGTSPSMIDGIATFADSISWYSATVTLGQPETVEGLSFEATVGGSYNLAGGPLTFSPGTESPFILAGNANVNADVISAPVVLDSDLTLSDAAGTLTLSGGVTGTGQIYKTGPGTLVLSSMDTDPGDAWIFSGQVTITPGGSLGAASVYLGVNSKLVVTGSSSTTVQHIGTLDLAGGTATFNSGSARTLVVTPSITTTPGSASLNLKTGDLDLTTESLAAVTGQVAAGYNLTGGGNWQGSGGITSSAAAAATSHLMALGVIQNNQSGSPIFAGSSTFDGTTPGVADVLVKYTYVGDANLDGKVDGSDYSLIDAGYASQGQQTGQLTGWYNGDFNYDGVIDGTDYALIDNAYNNQGTAIKSSALTATLTAQPAGPAAVPEPATAVILVPVLVALKRRRRHESGLHKSVKARPHIA